MNEQLKSVLNRVVILNDEECEAISSAFELHTVTSRRTLTRIGDVEDRLYFVIKGILRLYCLNTKEEETTIFIFHENNFASCYSSFLTEVPSDQALESLEECILLSLDSDTFKRLHLDIPKMNVLTRVIAEQRFINAQRIFTQHIMQTPEERYLEFERTQGNLLLRIPHHIIASFLGVTPVSLSRIRKRVARR